MHFRNGILLLIVVIGVAGILSEVRGEPAGKSASQNPAGTEADNTDQEVYFVALKLFQNRNYDLARNQLTRLLKEFPNSRLRESAEVLRGDSLFYMATQAGKRQFVQVIDEYRELLQRYPRSPIAPWFQLQIGRASCRERV